MRDAVTAAYLQDDDETPEPMTNANFPGVVDDWESDDDLKPDMVNQPPHYTSHPSSVECIQVTEHFNFCIGNAIKYLWRAGLKGDAAEDLKKAAWYVNREIERLNTTGNQP